MRGLVQLRATLQRTTPTLLIVLAVAIVLVGKADQAVLEPLRTRAIDAAVPVLDALSQPLSAAAAAVERVRGMANLYEDNLRLAEENRKLLQWQQVALKLSARKRGHARLAEGRAGKRGVVRDRPADRQFGRLCPDGNGQCWFGSGGRARTGGDRRRRPDRPADRDRQPRVPCPADQRPELAHPGRDPDITNQRRAGRRQFRQSASGFRE